MAGRQSRGAAAAARGVPGAEAAGAGQGWGCTPLGNPGRGGDPGTRRAWGQAALGTHPGAGKEKRTRGCTGAWGRGRQG